jgi:membrane protein required for colicin V production
MSLSALDGFILLVLAGGLARGLMAGAVRQIASIAGLLVAFFLSVQFMRPVGTGVVNSLGLAQSLAPVVGFVTLFVGIQILVIALSRMVEQILDSLHLGIANRAAGGVVGGFKAALLLSVLFLVLSSAGLPGTQVRQASALYRPVAGVLPETWDAAAHYVPRMRRISEQFGADVRPLLPRPATSDPATSDPEPGTPESAAAPDSSSAAESEEATRRW